MGRHIIVGAGSIGSATARTLRDRGEDVVMVTRRGTGIDGVAKVTADASDMDRMRELVAGADALYNCANPAYHRWVTDWPPIAEALLGAAESTGAVLVIMNNLYGYGPLAAPMTESTALRPTSAKAGVRVRMWTRALAAHEAGRIRVAEARAADFLGAGSQSLFGQYILPGVLAGKRVMLPCSPDMPHSFTYTGDAGTLMARLGTDDRAWGRAWHVPSNPPVTIRQLATRSAEMAGAPAPRLTAVPLPMLWLNAGFSRDIREFLKVRYQFTRPFEMDSTAAMAAFDLRPTPLDDVLQEINGSADLRP